MKRTIPNESIILMHIRDRMHPRIMFSLRATALLLTLYFMLLSSMVSVLLKSLVTILKLFLFFASNELKT